MIYAENQNVKTTPYKPPKGEAGRKFPRQYNRSAAANAASVIPEVASQSVQNSSVSPQSTPPVHMSSPDPEPSCQAPAPAAEAPVQDTQPPLASPPQSAPAQQNQTESNTESQLQTPRPNVSEWSNPPETAADSVPEQASDNPDTEMPETPAAPMESQAGPDQPLTLEQEEAQLEAMEGGPIPLDQTNPIPDLIPPGLTLEQAQKSPSYYENAADLRNSKPGPTAEERSGNPPQEAPMDSTGTVLVQVYTARQSLPIVDARVTVTHGAVENTELVSISMTDRDGRTRPLKVPTPAKALSEAPSPDGVIPFAIYDIRVEKLGYYTVNINDVQVFSGEQTLQTVDMTPLAEFANPQTSIEDFTVLPQNL